jgi:hypothetical protein
MPDVKQLGQAGLKGWREALADRVAPAAAGRTPASEDQVRAAIGALFFALAVIYVARTIGDLVKAARD